MKVYDTSRIRNVVVLGHGGAGKTTMVEAAAFVTGVTNRQGRVEDGNTISDFDKEEAKRLFSIGTSVVPIEYEDIKINFLDTPGYFDFAGEVEEALSAADAAVIDFLMAISMIGEGTSYEKLTHTVSLNEEKYGVGFRKNSDLVDELNEFFKTTYKDGTMKKIAEKYGIEDYLVVQE